MGRDTMVKIRRGAMLIAHSGQGTVAKKDDEEKGDNGDR